MITHSDKFNLKEIIYLYKNDPIEQPTPSKTAKIYSQAYLVQVCHYLTKKI